MTPIAARKPRRVNVDLASGMLEELDRAAKELNISRQAVIKELIRQALIRNCNCVLGLYLPETAA